MALWVEDLTSPNGGRAMHDAIVEALLAPDDALAILLDRHGRLLRSSRAAAEILGIQHFDSYFVHCLAPVDAGALLAALGRLQAADGPAGQSMLMHVQRRGGGEYIWQTTLNRLDLDTGTVFLGRAFDITGLKRSAEQLQRIVENSIQGVVIHRGGAPLFVNDSLAHMLGFANSGELMAQPSIAAFIHPDDLATVRGHIKARLSGEPAPLNYEFRLVRRDGSTHWVDCRASLVEWADGQAVLAALFDITDRKAAEAARLRSEALLTQVFQATPDVVTLTTLGEGRYIKVNDSFERVTGFSAADVIGRTSSEIGIWSDPNFRSNFLRLLRSEGAVRSLQTTARRKDGSEFPAEIAAEALNFEGRELLLVVARDISERKRQEAELRESKRAAELANRSKSEFLANMSHELRTPLNAIIGFSDIIRSEMLGEVGQPRYREYAEDIHRSGALLLAIINDILDLSKLEAGKLELWETAFPLGETIEECTRLVRQRAAEAGVKLQVVQPPSSTSLRADERLFKQIMLNLLSNAVKFTPHGGAIEVTVNHLACGSLAVAVRDTGIGMREDEIGKALTPFGQIDSTMTRRHAGTGLGLPLAKSLTELHGGRLEIQSERGKGTCVSIIMPASRDASVAA